MARRTQSRGQCAFCAKELTRSGMAKHLAACPERQKAIAAAHERAGKVQTLYHLQIQDAWSGAYWLQVEINGSARLDHLDRYLRAIWLECCGHLSQFSVGGWRGAEIAMHSTIGNILRPEMELTHIYDFGTSTETRIKLVGSRPGAPLSKHPIALMARNMLPEVACVECKQPAAWLCLECAYELDGPGTLCDTHAENHPHTDYGEPLPWVNSPRVGMCGYEGPAEPPY